MEKSGGIKGHHDGRQNDSPGHPRRAVVGRQCGGARAVLDPCPEQQSSVPPLSVGQRGARRLSFEAKGESTCDEAAPCPWTVGSLAVAAGSSRCRLATCAGRRLWRRWARAAGPSMERTWRWCAGQYSVAVAEVTDGSGSRVLLCVYVCRGADVGQSRLESRRPELTTMRGTMLGMLCRKKSGGAELQAAAADFPYQGRTRPLGREMEDGSLAVGKGFRLEVPWPRPSLTGLRAPTLYCMYMRPKLSYSPTHAGGQTADRRRADGVGKKADG